MKIIGILINLFGLSMVAFLFGHLFSEGITWGMSTLDKASLVALCIAAAGFITSMVMWFRAHDVLRK